VRPPLWSRLAGTDPTLDMSTRLLRISTACALTCCSAALTLHLRRGDDASPAAAQALLAVPVVVTVVGPDGRSSTEQVPPLQGLVTDEAVGRRLTLTNDGTTDAYVNLHAGPRSVGADRQLSVLVRDRQGRLLYSGAPSLLSVSTVVRSRQRIPLDVTIRWSDGPRHLDDGAALPALRLTIGLGGAAGRQVDAVALIT
jgi:hypothetical protein